MYSALTYDVMIFHLIHVRDKRIRNGYINWKQGLLCDKSMYIYIHKLKYMYITI